MDELPPSRYEHYVRQVLVHTGALPERHEEVDRIPAWLNQILADRPTRHAALVRPFVRWFLLRRARRRAAYRGQSFVAGSYLRTCTRVALELLTWLDEQQLELEDLTQGLLDKWLADGTTRSYTIRYFLTWAARRGLAAAMSVPSVPHRDPVRILAEEECWHQLHQLLNDTALPADVRAAGALVLLYGLQTTHIRQLRADHLREHDGQMHLAIGNPPVPVPPKLAALLRFDSESFDAVVSFFALIHLPLEDQLPLLRKIAGWLRPGGLFVATTGYSAWTGYEENWLDGGAPMWWSHADVATYRSWIDQAGLSIDREDFVPEDDGGHALFWTSRPQRPDRSAQAPDAQVWQAPARKRDQGL